MSDLSPCAIGIDIGGTKIAAGLVSLDTGRVTLRRQVATRPERGGAAVLAETAALARELLAAARAEGRAVRGVGVGVPELVDAEGRIASDHAIPWRGLPLAERLALDVPTAVEADVRAHALAEARYGAGRGSALFAFVTVGTGISSCLVQGGRPFAGARGNALVLASSPLTTTCTVCGARLQPVLEDFAGGPGLVARYNERSGAALERAEEVLAAAAAGDEVAADVVRSAGEALGVSLGWLVNVLDPERVVVGGGLGTAGGLYWSSAVAATRAHIYADATRDLPIVPAALGADAGLIGAAAGAAP
jgi:glucokinase